MPTTVFSDEDFSFLPQQWSHQQRPQMNTSPEGNASSPSSSSESSSPSYNEQSNSPTRSPDTTSQALMPANLGKPYLQILNEPYDKYRFRYKTEMQGTHGAILACSGQRSKSKKTYPRVKLCNYTPNKEGRAPIIRCSLYTVDEDEDKRVPHVHRLIGKENGIERDDPHDLIIHSPSYTAEFKNLTVLYTKKEEQEKVLLEKKQVHYLRRFIDFVKTSPPPLQSHELIRKKAMEELACMNLNVACLRFDALIYNGNGILTSLCKPVYSIPINNMKNPHTNELRICRVDRCTGSCLGGEEVFMFVEKVIKKNIKVKFYEEGPNKEMVWVDYGIFSQDDVHHQYGIVFRTPCYRDPNIPNNVEVYFQLERPSDKAVSDPMIFEYRPNPNRIRDMNRKRPRQEIPLPVMLGDYPPKLQTWSPAVSIDKVDTFLEPLITNSNSDDLIRDLFENSDLLMDQGEAVTSLESPEISFNTLMESLPSADSDAVSHFLCNERIDEYVRLNGNEEALKMLKFSQDQVTGEPINDLVFDGSCRLPRSSTIPNQSSDLDNHDRDMDLLHPQIASGNSTISTRNSSKTPAKLMLNEGNIVEKTEIILNNLLKLKKLKKIKKKFFQSCIIRLFSYTVEQFDNSVLHVLAATNQIPEPIQAAKFLNLLRVFNAIDSGIDIQNNKNETPLLVAARRGSSHMVSLFLEAGANVNATDIKNNTALHLAMLRDTESLNVVNALLSKPLNLVRYNEDGYTAFHLAVCQRKCEVISMLLIKSEDKLFTENLVNRQDRKRGNTALHLAVEKRFQEVVRLLLNFEKQIEIDATNFDGKTPLSFVMGETDEVSKEITKLLLDHKADSNLVVLEKSQKEEEYKNEFEFEPELEIIDADLDESESAYAREWDENELFDKTTITKLCPLLDKNDNWMMLCKRLKYTNSEIDYCKIHWSPSLSAFKIAELSKPEITAEVVRDELLTLGPHLLCCVGYIDDMLLERLGILN